MVKHETDVMLNYVSQINLFDEKHFLTKLLLYNTEGQIKIFFYKSFVKACVGARGPDWGFPEPK